MRDEEGGVALRDLRPIAPTLTQVVDVAWRDSEELLVLAGGAGDDRTGPYLVGVDGWGLDDVTVSGLPERPDLDRGRAHPRAARGRQPAPSGSSPAAPG